MSLIQFINYFDPFSTKHFPQSHIYYLDYRGCHGCGRMVVGFTNTCAISCEFETHSWWGVLEKTICDKVCQRLVAGLWFSPVSFINKNWTPQYYRVIAWIFVNIVPSSISNCMSLRVQYDILWETIFTNIHAITLLLYSKKYFMPKAFSI